MNHYSIYGWVFSIYYCFNLIPITFCHNNTLLLYHTDCELVYFDVIASCSFELIVNCPCLDSQVVLIVNCPPCLDSQVVLIVNCPPCLDSELIAFYPDNQVVLEYYSEKKKTDLHEISHFLQSHVSSGYTLFVSHMF